MEKVIVMKYIYQLAITIDSMKFILDLNNSESLKTGLNINKKINGFDIEVNSDYNLISKTPDYKTNLELYKKFFNSSPSIK